MRSFIVAALAAFTSASVSFNNDAYIRLTAAAKSAQILTAVNQDHASNNWYNAVESGGLFTESMSPTFDQAGDEMAPGMLWGTRAKYIHTIGNVATVKFVSSQQHPFSGMWKGADYGVVRLSLAAKASKTNTAPGMGLKFLIDGMDSSNLVAMFSVDGQESCNFFQNTFTNHIKDSKQTALAIVATKFSSVTSYVEEVGLSNFGKNTQNGAPEASLVFPFLIEFVPTGQLSTTQCSDGIFAELSGIPSGSLIYNVFGWNAPQELGGERFNMGELITTSALTTTKWGDEHLFYRHQRMDEDLVYHPEWEPYVLKWKCMAETLAEDTPLEPIVRASKCPFGFLH